MLGKENISEEKARRIAVGATVGGVFIAVLLIIILVVQFVQIGVGNSRKEQLDKEIEEYNRLISEKENDLEWYRSASGLYYTARQYGWR